MLGAQMAGKDEAKIYERLAADLPMNAQVVPEVVDDPYALPGQIDKSRVLRSVRDDPLAGMKARGQIDSAQFEAGRLWQQYREDSEIGGAQAIDTTKEAVDGGRFKEPDLTKLSRALRELRAANDDLGAYGASLIEDILGRRMSIAEVAQARNMSRELEVKYIGRRFRECLESLAKLWGFAG
jgi:hypothetical protein